MVNYPTILNLPQKDINRQLYERVLKLQVKAKYHVLSLTVNDGTDPISGATVVIGEESETTGADGKATFTLPYDDYSVSISATGFESATETLQFRSNHKSFTVSLTATGGDTGTVTVTALSDTGGGADPVSEGVVLLTTAPVDWTNPDPTIVVASCSVFDETGTGTLATVQGQSTDIPFDTYYLCAMCSEDSTYYSGTLTVDGDETVTITLIPIDGGD